MSEKASKALAALWASSYGPAADLVSFLKKHPEDPRGADIKKIELLLQRFVVTVNERDIAGATIASTDIDRAMFHCNNRKLAPIVKRGRRAKEAEAKAVEKTHGSEKQRLEKQERRRALFKAELDRGVARMKAYENVAKAERVGRKTIERAVASRKE